MKHKLLSLLLTLCMAFSLCSTVNASEAPTLSDDEIKEIFQNSTFTKKDNEGIFYFESSYNPTTINTRSNIETEAHTTFAIIPENAEEEKSWDELVNQSTSPQSRASYNNYGEQWDSSYSVKAYCTVYYTVNGNSALLTKVTGGYSKSDRAVRVTGQTLLMGCNQGFLGQTEYKYPAGTSFSYNANSSWQPIQTDVTTGLLGATYTLTIVRSASPWTLTLENKPLFTGAW